MSFLMLKNFGEFLFLSFSTLTIATATVSTAVEDNSAMIDKMANYSALGILMYVLKKDLGDKLNKIIDDLDKIDDDVKALKNKSEI